jgi:hypothetical protein
MSKYQEFCDSLWLVQAKTREEQLLREDEEHVLRQMVGEVVRRMCDAFECPAEQVRYVDTQAGMAIGTLGDSEPLLRFNPVKGRYALDLEIGVRGRPPEPAHPVWVHLEVVPLKHGGWSFTSGRTSSKCLRKKLGCLPVSPTRSTKTCARGTALAQESSDSNILPIHTIMCRGWETKSFQFQPDSANSAVASA